MFGSTPLDQIRIIVFLLYAPVTVVVYWRLIPRLSPAGKLLATVLLAAQVLLISLPTFMQQEPGVDKWFWSVDSEYTAPNIFAAAQLALVCTVALARACLDRELSVWERLYLVGIALVFLLIAREELIEKRHVTVGEVWPVYYMLLGAAIVAATAIIANRSPRVSRIWHICFLAGLSLSAAGAIVVEQLRFKEVCDQLGLMSASVWGEERCLTFYVEESFEFLGVWLALVAMLGLFSSATQLPRLRLRLAVYALPAFAFIAIVLSSPYAVTRLTYVANRLPNVLLGVQYKFYAQPAMVRYESDVDLRGFRIDHNESAFSVKLYAAPDHWFAYSGLGFSIHLVDQVTGRSITGADASARRWGRIQILSPHRDMHTQTIEVDILPQSPTNRALWVVLTTWSKRDNKFPPLKVISSDLHLLSDTQVVLGEIVLRAVSAESYPASLATFDNGFSLAAIDLPESARPGTSLPVPMTWRATKDGAQDYVQFVHFIHEDTGQSWGYDQQPLGARLPTRLWYGGLADTEVWDVLLPSDLATGVYKLFTGLYRASDGERLPAKDVDGTPIVDARVPLGFLTIESA